MAQPLDIFRIEPEGGVRWIASAENLDEAKLLIKAAAASLKQPGDFLIVNLTTGEKTRIKAPAA